MAIKITKTDDKRIREALEALAAKRAAVTTAVDTFNSYLETIRGDLEAVIAEHDEAAQALRGLVEDIHREAEEEFDGKSERWQEGERGEAAREWIDNLDGYVTEIEDADVAQLPGNLEADDVLPTDPTDEYDALDKEPQQ